MLITSYNPNAMGDVLIAMIKPETDNQISEKKDNIVRIYDKESNETLGYNFFEVTKILGKLANVGPLTLTKEQVSELNAALKSAGFRAELVADETPKFVVGYVESTSAHPDSDHLKITKTKIDNGQFVQIVSGSPNMTDNIKVVVAKVGAIMPDGLVIWPGELRGVESDGMICSGRELKLKNAPQKKGALILPDNFKVGEAFDFEAGNKIFS